MAANGIGTIGFVPLSEKRPIGWHRLLVDHAQAADGSTRLRDGGRRSTRGLRSPAPCSTGRDYAAAISRVALIGSFSTLQSALKFASRGLT